MVGAAGIGVDGGNDPNIGKWTDFNFALGCEMEGQFELCVGVQRLDPAQDQGAAMGQMKGAESFG